MPFKSKLTPSEWAQAITAYERGEKKIPEIADEYGVDHSTIAKGFRSRGVVRRSTLSEGVGQDEEDVARKEREELVTKAKRQQETFFKYNTAIAQMTMKRLIEGDKEGGSLKSKNAEILVLKNASQIIMRARQENWEILGIEDILGEDEQLPDLNISEYTPEEIEEIRREQEDHYLESNDLESAFGGDDEGFED